MDTGYYYKDPDPVITLSSAVTLTRIIPYCSVFFQQGATFDITDPAGQARLQRDKTRLTTLITLVTFDITDPAGQAPEQARQLPRCV